MMSHWLDAPFGNTCSISAGPGQFIEAGDGEAAIAIGNNRRPDLLFLDVVMPGATGLEVLERLEYEPKVIFTTAHDQYAVRAFELGALDYLLKPFGRDRLERVLRRAQAALNGLATPVLSRPRESLEQVTATVADLRSRWRADPSNFPGEPGARTRRR